MRSQLGGVAASQSRTEGLIIGRTGSQKTEQAGREGHSSQASLGHAGREGRSSQAPAASILRTHSTGRSPRGGADTSTG